MCTDCRGGWCACSLVESNTGRAGALEIQCSDEEHRRHGGEEKKKELRGERARYVQSTTAAPVILYKHAKENEPRRASFSDTMGGAGGGEARLLDKCLTDDHPRTCNLSSFYSNSFRFSVF